MFLISQFIIVFLLSTIYFMHCSECAEDFYTSLANMEMLIETQAIVIETMNEHVAAEKKKLNEVKDYMTQCQDLYKQASKIGVHDDLTIAINAYKLRKLQEDMNILENVIRNRTEYQRNNRAIYPRQRDLVGATQGFLRLQTTYKLNVTELANGILRSYISQHGQPYTEFTIPLKTDDCYYLGTFQKYEENRNTVVDWLIEALNKYANDSCELNTFEKKDVFDKIIEEYCKQGDFKKTLEWSIKRNIFSNKSVSCGDQMETVKEEFIKCAADQKENDDEIESDEEVFKKYARGLCRQDTNVTYRLMKCVSSNNPLLTGLKCSYKTGPHPFLKLARIKTEQLHHQPDIWMFHDVISDSEIQAIINRVKRKLQRAHEKDVNYFHVAEGIMLNEKDAHIQPIIRRITDYTDLSNDEAEQLQVINYGIGGHNDPHYDWYGKESLPVWFKDYGDLLASTVIYLSDVTQGGATLFTWLKLKVYPKKGSAILFKSLDRFGNEDYSTIHQSCPVLRGNKWIAAKWMHESAQNYCPIP